MRKLTHEYFDLFSIIESISKLIKTEQTLLQLNKTMEMDIKSNKKEITDLQNIVLNLHTEASSNEEKLDELKRLYKSYINCNENLYLNITNILSENANLKKRHETTMQVNQNLESEIKKKNQ